MSKAKIKFNKKRFFVGLSIKVSRKKYIPGRVRIMFEKYDTYE